MTREEHLKFCRNCDHRILDLQKGIICKLTNDMADFEDYCPDYSGIECQSVSTEIENTEPPDLQGKRAVFLRYLIPHEGFIVTPVIVLLCILIFTSMVISGVSIFNPDAQDLLLWGGNFRPVTLEGQYWRLLTNVFLHAGFIHLIFNMVALIYIGTMLEPKTGSLRFAIFYIVTGICASVASLSWHELTVSVGASGAIFGLFGVYLGMLLTNQVDTETRNKILGSLAGFVAYNLMYGLKEGIDNAAHVGGLMSGFLIGISLYPAFQSPGRHKRNTLITGSAIMGLFVIAGLIISHVPNYIGKYQDIMVEFSKMEQKAMKFYELPQNSTDKQYLDALTIDGIPNWKKCKTILSKTDSLSNLPPQLIKNANLVKKYCDLRIKDFELIARSIRQPSLVQDYRIQVYNEKIDMILRKLQGEEISDELINMDLKQKIYQDMPGSLYVIDGIPGRSLENVNLDSMRLISIYNIQAAMQLYGDSARNGVVIISSTYF